VTADHLDRHGTLEAYRAVKRRLAELVDPAGALVLNADDPVVAGYGARPGARSCATGAASCPRRPRRGPRLDRRRRHRAVDGAGSPARRGGRILPLDELGIPGAHNVSNALAATAVALLFGIAPDAIDARAGPRSRAWSTGSSAWPRSTACASSNDSQGTQPDAVIAALRAFGRADRAHRRRPGQGRRPGRAGDRRRRARRCGGPDRRERPGARAAVPRGGLANTERAATLEDAVEAADELARAAAGRTGTRRRFC
jgi:UDP-N-acetylmuramoylalanine--D-glutamate ligase